MSTQKDRQVNANERRERTAVEIFQEMTRKIYLATAQAMERAERIHRERYPDAINHGRHASGTVKNAVMFDGSEFIGRHRARFDHAYVDHPGVPGCGFIDGWGTRWWQCGMPREQHPTMKGPH